MTAVVLAVFCLVYLGMLLGGLPFLSLDRTGIALLGAITLLALSSTLAGSLLLVGSIANLIVADAAGRYGVALDRRVHARTGVPVTLVTLAIAGGWVWVVGNGSL